MTKQFAFLLSALFFVGGCKPDPKGVHERKVNSLSPPKVSEAIGEIQPKPSKGIAGTWINRKYVDKLLLTKSTRASQSEVHMTMVFIPSKEGEEVTIIWGFHEGTSGILVEKEGTYFVQIDTLLNELQFDEDILKFKDNEFLLIAESKDARDWDVAEQLLFSGIYQLGDVKIELKADGRVLGMDSISYYTVFMDYWDAGMEVDLIELGRSPAQVRPYGFKFSGSELTIYELNCLAYYEDYCVEIENGDVAFSMVKK